MANEKIKKPKFKKTNITVVDAKTGKKKRKATNTMNLENFMNFINMNYPKGPQTKDPSPAIERNRRQSKKALEIINSRKKAGGGKVYKYKKGTSDKTIIGKNKGVDILTLLVRSCYNLTTTHTIGNFTTVFFKSHFITNIFR